MNEQIHADSFLELYDWLKENHGFAPYVWVNSKRGKPNGMDLNYLDVVYAALCFGWIDSTCRKIDGVPSQKLMPRGKSSHWSYLNIARCLYLKEQSLMTVDGMHAMPKGYEDFSIAEDILERLQEDSAAWENFCCFPLLYQRIRIDNIEWARKDKKTFEARMEKLIDKSRQGILYGQWDDYGRLADFDPSCRSMKK